ncbi:MAG: ROK family protein [Pyrinomonadaceae bacterium]|nr:ROK family protein [Blastocatellia bacterium]MCW5958449.1 ROK family protein [Pyrinomonadaceae bacterium]
MEKLILAADLGGTNLRMAAVSRSGDLAIRRKVCTPTSKTREDILAAIEETARSIRSELGDLGELAAFGAAVPAIVNSKQGIVLRSPNLPELNGLEFSSYFSDRLKMPVVLENDANSAAVGEFWKGASRGVQSSVCVTLGTGVGGGIIIDGKLLRGIDGTAGEIGHIAVEPEGHPCGCGSKGCVEQYSSAIAIKRITAELLPRFPASVLSGISDITPFKVYEAGKSGDELAIEIFRIFGTYLGIALGGLVNVLNPETIVIGGGVAAGWDLFVDHVRDEIFRRAFKHPAERVRLVRSELGDDAGIIGAAFLGSERVYV